MGETLDVLLKKNLLVSLSAGCDANILQEQGKIINVVEANLGPNTGIAEVKCVLKDAGYVELASQVAQVHGKRAGAAHPRINVAERLHCALEKIGNEKDNHSAAGQPTDTCAQQLVLDELIPVAWSKCMNDAWNVNHRCNSAWHEQNWEPMDAASLPASSSIVHWAPDEFILELTSDDIELGTNLDRRAPCELGNCLGLPLDVLNMDKELHCMSCEDFECKRLDVMSVTAGYCKHDIEHIELKGKEFASMDDCTWNDIEQVSMASALGAVDVNYIDIRKDDGKPATLEEIEEICNEAFAAQAANIKLYNDKTLEEMRSSLCLKGGWHDGG